MSRLRKSPDELRAESPWDWLLQQSERDQRERRGYVEACNLDRDGEHEKADEILRAAGVSAEVVDQRRAHISWRVAQGFPAIDSP
jgi:hypothetical protein